MSAVYCIRYRKPGDVSRVRRSEGGRKRRFTREEADEFLIRNGENYPNARIRRLRVRAEQPVKRKKVRRS